jgi:deoxyribodipyrimidine photo-lyase
MTDLSPATRTDALSRLTAFAPYAGHDYADGRNTDFGPDAPSAVSKLSPYLRHRLLTEQEVVSAVLAQHDLKSAEKFVQEVLWRTYWKGWLEMRPTVWTRFLAERDLARETFPNARAIAAAESGMTGIEGFDDWARELVETGFLHNHARMWFASIWIFTLRLPWTLGADFFLRHLVDADPASNTLSWRWVAGLQTAGKTYLATTENIERYTNGRFAPKGLAAEAVVLPEEPVGKAMPLPAPEVMDTNQPVVLLLTSEDMAVESFVAEGNVAGSLSPIIAAVVANDPELTLGEAQRGFIERASDDVAARTAATLNVPVSMVRTLSAETMLNAARAAGATQIVTPYAPIGPVADALAVAKPVLAQEGVSLKTVRRHWDAAFWPYATKGFFPFKAQIPAVLRELGIV